jgi:hypothetical protein
MDGHETQFTTHIFPNIQSSLGSTCFEITGTPAQIAPSYSQRSHVVAPCPITQSDIPRENSAHMVITNEAEIQFYRQILVCIGGPGPCIDCICNEQKKVYTKRKDSFPP